MMASQGLTSQESRQKRVCFPLAKFSSATSSAEGPIPWAHLSSRSDLFAVFDTNTLNGTATPSETAAHLRVLQDPDVLEDLDLAMLASEARRTAADARELQDYPRNYQVTVVIRVPCIAMRYPTNNGLVRRFQIRFVHDNQFFEARNLLITARVPFTEASDTTKQIAPVLQRIPSALLRQPHNLAPKLVVSPCVPTQRLLEPHSSAQYVNPQFPQAAVYSGVSSQPQPTPPAVRYQYTPRPSTAPERSASDRYESMPPKRELPFSFPEQDVANEQEKDSHRPGDSLGVATNVTPDDSLTCPKPLTGSMEKKKSTSKVVKKRAPPKSKAIPMPSNTKANSTSNRRLTRSASSQNNATTSSAPKKPSESVASKSTSQSKAKKTSKANVRPIKSRIRKSRTNSASSNQSPLGLSTSQDQSKKTLPVSASSIKEQPSKATADTEQPKQAAKPDKSEQFVPADNSLPVTVTHASIPPKRTAAPMTMIAPPAPTNSDPNPLTNLQSTLLTPSQHASLIATTTDTTSSIQANPPIPTLNSFIAENILDPSFVDLCRYMQDQWGHILHLTN